MARSGRRGEAYLAHARYAWALRRESVDVLHAPHTFVPFFPGCRVVVTIYDLMSELFPEYRERVESRPYRMFRHAVRTGRGPVIAISRTTAGDLERVWGLASSRIHVVYLGARSDEPELPASGASQPAALDRSGTPFLLSPYNLEPRKNLRALLTAFSRVRRAHPSLRLVLFGRAAVTPEREREFQTHLAELRLERAVELTGLVPDGQLQRLYRGAALFVFPSLYEGFGLPVLEAMAAGACVVARNQSAMAEVMGGAGAQVETADPDALADVMTTLLDDTARRTALGAAARARARTFTLARMARETLGVYTAALEQPI